MGFARVCFSCSVAVLTIAMVVCFFYHDWSTALPLALVLSTILYCAVVLLAPRITTRLTRLLRFLSGIIVLVLGLMLAAAAIHVALTGLRKDAEPPGLFYSIYRAAQFFVLNVDPTSDRSPVSPYAAILASTLFLVIALQGISVLFHDSLARLRLWFCTKHIVICGVGRIGHQLVNDLVSQAGSQSECKGSDWTNIVVIERDPEHPDLPWLKEHGVLVVIGEAQRGETLARAKVERAGQVFVVTGSDEVNVESVIEIRDYLARSHSTSPSDRLECYVHLRDRDLAASMRARVTELERHSSDRAGRRIDIEVFNAGERSVRRLLEDLVHHREWLPMQEAEVAHFVILGFGNFGQSLALSLAELGHFPNIKRLRLTIADRGIEEVARTFLARYPRFTHLRRPGQPPMWTPGARSSPPFCASAPAEQDHWHHRSETSIDFVCNARFVELADVAEERWVVALDEDLMRERVKPIVFVCFDEDRVNFKLAERLRAVRDRLGDRYDDDANHTPTKTGIARWPIYVWIPAQRELSQVLAGASSPDPRPFGHCFGAVSYHELVHNWSDRLARFFKFGYTAAYRENVECRASWANLAHDVTGLPQTYPSMGLDCDWKTHEENAKKIWEAEEQEAYRASDRSAAIHAVVKMAALGLELPATRLEPATSAAVTGNGLSIALTRLVRSLIGTDKRGRCDNSASLRPRGHANAREWALQLLAHAKHPSGIPVTDDCCTLKPNNDAFLPAAAAMLGRLVQMEHYRWCSERLLTGWRYGNAVQDGPLQQDAKNDRKNRQLRHWDLVCFDKLGRSQVKDHFSVHVVLALAAADEDFPIGWLPPNAVFHYGTPEDAETLRNSLQHYSDIGMCRIHSGSTTHANAYQTEIEQALADGSRVLLVGRPGAIPNLPSPQIISVSEDSPDQQLSKILPLYRRSHGPL